MRRRLDGFQCRRSDELWHGIFCDFRCSTVRGILDTSTIVSYGMAWYGMVGVGVGEISMKSDKSDTAREEVRAVRKTAIVVVVVVVRKQRA